MSDDKPFRMFSVRLATDDFLKLEEIREILQNKAKEAGVSVAMSRPELMKHLIEMFFSNRNSEKSDSNAN